MSAAELLSRYGLELLGKIIDTPAMGEYPGGHVKVMGLNPDRRAPEIVLEVLHPTAGRMGVFDHEEVELVEQP